MESSTLQQTQPLPTTQEMYYKLQDITINRTTLNDAKTHGDGGATQEGSRNTDIYIYIFILNTIIIIIKHNDGNKALPNVEFDNKVCRKQRSLGGIPYPSEQRNTKAYMEETKRHPRPRAVRLTNTIGEQGGYAMQ